MVFSLFSQFDFSFSFGVAGFLFLILFFTFFLNVGFYFGWLNVFLSYLFGLVSGSIIRFEVFFLLFLFFILFRVNFFSLIPYGFSFSSQIWFGFFFRFGFFLVFIFVFLLKRIFSIVSHFVPAGSPLFLGFLLFWVEFFSSIIRPFTLVLRLCANMLAGHVLLSVFSGLLIYLLFVGFSFYVLFFPFCLLFFLFEFVVCFIQGVVFVLLLYRYFSEILYYCGRFMR